MSAPVMNPDMGVQCDGNDRVHRQQHRATRSMVSTDIFQILGAQTVAKP
jgi:hypothetical protein